MPAEKPKQTEKFHWVRSSNYETRSVESVLVQETRVGKCMLYFYNERTAFEGTNEFELLDDGQLGKEVIDTITSDAVFEVHQGILLDVNQARNLRDNLSKFLRDDAS